MDETRNTMDSVRFPNIPLKPSIILPPTTQQANYLAGVSFKFIFKLHNLWPATIVHNFSKLLYLASVSLSFIKSSSHLESQRSNSRHPCLNWNCKLFSSFTNNNKSTLRQRSADSQLKPVKRQYRRGPKLKARPSVLVLFQISRSSCFPKATFYHLTRGWGIAASFPIYNSKTSLYGLLVQAPTTKTTFD